MIRYNISGDISITDNNEQAVMVEIIISTNIDKYQIMCRSLGAGRLRSGNCQAAVSLVCD
jgi:hypothetical protein